MKTLAQVSLASKLWDKKDVILKSKAEKLLKTKGKATRVVKSKPENEAEKLLKIRSCGKNEPENTGWSGVFYWAHAAAYVSMSE